MSGHDWCGLGLSPPGEVKYQRQELTQLNAETENEFALLAGQLNCLGNFFA